MSDPTEVIARGRYERTVGAERGKPSWEDATPSTRFAFLQNAAVDLETLCAYGFEIYRPEECETFVVSVSNVAEGIAGWALPDEGEYRLVPVSEGTDE